MTDDVIETALGITSRRLAELVTRLMAGETLSQGELMRYAAYVGPKYRTPELDKRFGKRSTG